VNEFSTRIPVAAGDLIGLHIIGKPHGCASDEVHGPLDVVAGTGGDTPLPTDPVPGFIWTPSVALAQTRVNVAATLEDPSPPAPQPGMDLRLEAAPKQNVKKLEVTVGCGPAACEASMGGKAVAKKKGGSKKRAAAAGKKKKKKKFKLKPKPLSLEAGERVTKRLKYRKNRKSVKKLRRLLKRKAYRKRSKAKIKATASDAAGNTAAEKLKVKLKR
jgi:hypothetical protein